MLVGEGETCREISSSANHFDVTGRFGGTCLCQRVIELAERRHLGGEPILAAQGGWQQMVVPGGQVVVFPIRIFFECPLDHVTLVVEDEDNRLEPVTAHSPNVTGGHLMRAFPRE